MTCRRLAVLAYSMLSLLLAFAGDKTASRIADTLNSLEEWAHGRKFTWRAKVSIEYEMDEQAYNDLQTQVEKIGGQLLERSYNYRTTLEFTVVRKGERMVVRGWSTNGRVNTPMLLFLDRGMYIVGTYPIYAMPAGSKPGSISEAYVFSCKEDMIYDYVFQQPFLYSEPGLEFFYGLLVFVSPKRLFTSQPIITRRGQAIELSGTATHLERMMRVQVRPNGQVSKISIPFKLGAFEKNVEYSFGSYLEKDGQNFYKELLFEKTEISPEQRRKVSILFELENIKTCSEEDMSIDLPLGCMVSDFRLISKHWNHKDYQEFFRSGSRWDEVVRYRWQGILPDPQQLEKLAYQQGNLLPPETPQRRYSFWMFLPAIILFGLALLFYLRRRR